MPIERREAVGIVGASRPVEHVEGDVDVATVLVRPVACDRASVLSGELTDREAPARHATGDVGRGPLEQVHELGRAIEVAGLPVLARMTYEA